MDRFYIADKIHALDIANILLNAGFQEYESVILDDDDEAPMLHIDTTSSSFFFLDEGAFEHAKLLIHDTFNEQFHPITTETVAHWKF